MKRPLVIHGGDRALIERVGRAAAARLDVEFRDAFEEPEILRSAGRLQGLVLGCRSEWLLDRPLRVELLARATVVAIDPVAELLDEAGELGRGAQAWKDRLQLLLGAEFREGHGCFTASEVGEADLVSRIVELAMRQPVVVAAGERSYLVEVGKGVVEAGVAKMAFGSPTMLYLTDGNVDRLHGARLGEALEGTGLRVVRHVLVPGEEAKCLSALGEIFDAALAGGIDRSSWLVAAGGGVTTDIGGLVAALWMRGVRWLGIPTTLLAMVDASVGGKTAVDHGPGKNAVGAFWQPSQVICDVEFLLTEGERNYVGALSEVVKTAVIGDVELFEALEGQADLVLSRDLDFMSEVVRRCVQVKARIVGLDERENGLRAVLNFGHTVGHALEALGQYRKYTHGEAVSLGMAVALGLGVQLGYTPAGCAERISNLLTRLGLPVKVERDELVASAELLGHDKKRAGSALRFVFARGIGNVGTERIALEDVRELVGALAVR